MSITSKTYQSYLLRFWRRDETKTWRVTVRNVDTEQHHHFATLDEAVAFFLGWQSIHSPVLSINSFTSKDH